MTDSLFAQTLRAAHDKAREIAQQQPNPNVNDAHEVANLLWTFLRGVAEIPDATKRKIEALHWTEQVIRPG